MVVLIWLCRVVSACLLGLALICWPFFINFYAEKNVPLESYLWVFGLIKLMIGFRVLAGVASLTAYGMAYEKSLYRLLLELTTIVYCVLGILCSLVIGIVSAVDMSGGNSCILDPERIFPTSIMVMLDLALLCLIVEEWLKLRARAKGVRCL